jgi:MmyB-like transcription regulator ligand binding domain
MEAGPRPCRRVPRRLQRETRRPADQALIAELSARSPFFASAWTEHGVIGREGGVRTFDHPLDGFVRYEQITLHLANRPELKLVMLSPLAADVP